MAELTTIARPYAKAAFEFARDAGKLSAWSEALAFAAALSQDEAFAAYLTRPTLTAAQQAEALLKAAGDKLSAEAKNFVTEVAENKRLDALPAIAELFDAFKAEHEKSAEVVVTSAFDLDAAQKQQLASSLTKKLGRTVAIDSVTIDKSLIGGVVIRSGDLVIDASVRGKLNKLATTLNS